jgi:hypothetical protein
VEDRVVVDARFELTPGLKEIEEIIRPFRGAPKRTTAGSPQLGMHLENSPGSHAGRLIQKLASAAPSREARFPGARQFHRNARRRHLADGSPLPI